MKKTARLSNASKKSLNQFIAAVAAGFLPVASFVIAHVEAPTTEGIEIFGFSFKPLFILVIAALAYSAPTLATWAMKWAGHKSKAYAFTVLLEGVMVFSHLWYLSFTGLLILVSINATTAWTKAAKR